MKSLRAIKENWKILLAVILLVGFVVITKHYDKSNEYSNCTPTYDRTGELNDSDC
jgi:hypothetical protein